jgi:hypothetical protein
MLLETVAAVNKTPQRDRRIAMPGREMRNLYPDNPNVMGRNRFDPPRGIQVSAGLPTAQETGGEIDLLGTISRLLAEEEEAQAPMKLRTEKEPLDESVPEPAIANAVYTRPIRQEKLLSPRATQAEESQKRTHQDIEAAHAALFRQMGNAALEQALYDKILGGHALDLIADRGQRR